MPVKKRASGNFQARFQVNGQPYKRTFSTQREAKAWETQITAQINAGKTPSVAHYDSRRLPELIELWHQIHGHTLKDAQNRKSRLLFTSQLMGNPMGTHLTARYFADYRQQRLASGTSANNCNRELAYLKAMFSELTRQELWQSENPLKQLRPLKFDETEMHYLTHTEIEKLLHECEQTGTKHLAMVVKLCLATGARWNEANQLMRQDVQVNQSRARVIYTGTKSGKNRRIPITVTLAKEVLDKGHKTGRLFVDCSSQFRRAVERTGIQLPKGQMTHVLRHTFASHFMANGGDVLKLQNVLGHATLQMTLRYAHLAPDALDAVLDKNPLAKINLDKKSEA